MAVYQYYLEVLPKEGIFKKHNLIPSHIKVSTETGYFESDSEIYWNEVKCSSKNIIPKMDSIIDRTNWGDNKTSFNWKRYSEALDNDASISLNESDFTIKEFSFRADLRDENLEFLNNMISLANENEWMFMDRNGLLINSNIEEFINSILKSNSYNFLNNPYRFLDNLENK
ncbi:hypothetical protein [Empedobacter brevis]|uniref:hypothetical protein n=1 Tax=Empedobacter brevis TaxID=247 RepID=UPI0028D3A1F9|nr:hypothetical protein [Empedobacter brevis]